MNKTFAIRVITIAAWGLASAAFATDLRCHPSRVIAFQPASKFITQAARSRSLPLQNKPIAPWATVINLAAMAASSEKASTETVSYNKALDMCDQLESTLSGFGYKCEPDCQVEADGTIPNDTYYSSPTLAKSYSGDQRTAIIDSANPEAAWAIETGENCDAPIVAVIDTGVDYKHGDLAANIWTNTDEIPNNGKDDDNNGYIDDVRGYDFVNDDNDPFDDNGHGTHVAGTIGARGNNGQGVAGMMWKAKLMPLKFLAGSGSGYLSDAIHAIDYAVANGAKVLNNSWGGGGYSAALETAINNAVESGVLVVAAAGNSARNNDKISNIPANFDGVISVAAVDKNSNLASFSNYGQASVHLAAPGSQILSTYPGGYAWLSGTSMATPHVSGALALAACKNPSLSAAQLKSYLFASVKQVSSLSGLVQTGGTLDIGALLEAVGNAGEAPGAGDGSESSDPTPTTPSDDTVITLSDTESGDAALQAGKSFSLTIESKDSGNAQLKLKLGRVRCRRPNMVRDMQVDGSYEFSGSLPAIAGGLDSLEFRLTQGRKLLATASSSITGAAAKKRKRSRAAGKSQRVQALRICKAVSRSLALAD